MLWFSELHWYLLCCFFFISNYFESSLFSLGWFGSLSKGLSMLFIFSKKQFLYWLCVFFDSISLSSAIILIYVHIYHSRVLLVLDFSRHWGTSLSYLRGLIFKIQSHVILTTILGLFLLYSICSCMLGFHFNSGLEFKKKFPSWFLQWIFLILCAV